MAESVAQLSINAIDDGLVLTGELGGPGLADFSKALGACVDAGGFVRLDMSGVTSIDTESLRAIVVATGRSRTAGADLVLDAPIPAVAGMVESCGLSWLLTMINVTSPAARAAPLN